MHDTRSGKKVQACRNAHRLVLPGNFNYFSGMEHGDGCCIHRTCFGASKMLRRFLSLWTMVAPRGDVGMTRRDSLWLQLYYCHVRHNAKDRRDPKRFSNDFRLCKSSRSGTDLGEQKSCGNGNCWAKLGLYRPVEWQWVPSYRSAIAAKFLQLPLRNGVLLSGVLSRDPPKAGVRESCGCKEYSLDSWYTDTDIQS